jgi:ASTRA-associated protein 1
MAQAPAVPTYILRGHNAPIHTVHFLSANAFLASGDSQGWLVIWSLASKRPVGVWKAHDSCVTNIKSWGQDRLLTYVSRLRYGSMD